MKSWNANSDEDDKEDEWVPDPASIYKNDLLYVE